MPCMPAQAAVSQGGEGQLAVPALACNASSRLPSQGDRYTRPSGRRCRVLTSTLVGVWPADADGAPVPSDALPLTPDWAAVDASFAARLAVLHGGPAWDAPHALFEGVYPARDGVGAFTAVPAAAADPAAQGGGEAGASLELRGFYGSSVQAALAYDRCVRARQRVSCPCV